MITLLSRRLKSNRKVMASKANRKGSASTRENQEVTPVRGSEAHRRAEELASQVQRESVVDKEKVSRIKAEIEAGTYKVNAESIAEKLMEIEFKRVEKSKS